MGMFSKVNKMILMCLIFYGNSDCCMEEAYLNFIVNSPGGRLRFYTYAVNYITMFALTLGLFKKITYLGKLHSFFMTLCLPLQFTLTTVYYSILKYDPTAFIKPVFKEKQFND